MPDKAPVIRGAEGVLRLIADCCWFALLGGGLLFTLIAPLPEPPLRVLQESDLLGEWVANWSGCPWKTHMGARGDYHAIWENSVYRGSWWVGQGRLHINESNCPDDFDTYITYEIALDRRTLRGPIMSANGEKRPGTFVIEFTKEK